MSYPSAATISAAYLRQGDRIEYRKGGYRLVLATCQRGSRVFALCAGENTPRVMRSSDPLRIERQVA